MEASENKDRKKNMIIILLIILLLLAGAATAYVFLKPDPAQKTAVLVDADGALQEPDKTGEISISVSNHIVVQEGTMQNLYFANNNKDRLMSCKIKVGDNIVYESPKIESGQSIKADVVETKYLKQGEQDMLIEMYTYDTDEKMTNQSNVTGTIEFVN